MPSSSWRLIHGGDDAPRPSALPEQAAPEPEDGGRAAVLRGRNRPATHNAPNATGSAVVSSAAPVIVESPEAVAIREEIRNAEVAAEERGYQLGVARAEAELRAAVEGAGALAERIQSNAPERTSEIAHAIAELALAVAKRVVQHEVRIEPSLLCAALEAAVSTINGSPEAHVMLNPAAVEPVRQAWEALHGRAYLGKHWTFEGDPALPVGGCTLRYEHGFVEAGLEAQLEEIGIAIDRAIPGIARGTLEEEVA
jgi:flagellar assembly protein FliH